MTFWKLLGRSLLAVLPMVVLGLAVFGAMIFVLALLGLAEVRVR